MPLDPHTAMPFNYPIFPYQVSTMPGAVLVLGCHGGVDARGTGRMRRLGAQRGLRALLPWVFGDSGVQLSKYIDNSP